MKKKNFKNWSEFINHLKNFDYNYAYLSGTISEIGTNTASMVFETFRKLLINEDIYSTSTFSQLHPKRRKKIYYIKHGIKALVDADVVLILGDNTNSKGSKIEEHLAIDLDMPVYLIDFNRDEEITINNLKITKIN